MSIVRWFGVVTIVCLSVAGCRGDRKRPSGDSATFQSTQLDTTLQIDTGAHWNPALGSLLVLTISPASEDVIVLPPDYVEGRYDDTSAIDLRRFSNLRLDLFGRGNGIANATLSAQIVRRSGTEGDCTMWPTGRLKNATSRWTVGLESGHATVIPLDSIESLSPTDSARFAAEVIRLASGSPATRDTLFGSIPFAIQSAYRFHTGTIDGIVATVRRTIPSEADPREDHTMFIAERPAGSTQPYQIAFVKRDAGEEDDTFVVNILAAVILNGDKRPTLIVTYDYDEGDAVGLIERVAPRHWQATWTSAYTGC